jgi:REP element-mobilizing transposase RayT
MPYWRLFYHLVWTTKQREPLLTPQVEPLVYRCLRAEAKEMHSPLCVVGGIEDHVHVLAAFRPAVSPATFVQQLKGSSSHLVTSVLHIPFEWQEGYGVFSVSESDVEYVIRYIRNQKQHHANNTLVNEWEQVHNWNIGPSEEQYRPLNGDWDHG